MTEHNHEHTHEVVRPDGSPAHGEERHGHSHNDQMNGHHPYSEEPKVSLGPITPGQWQCALDRGVGTPYIYVARGDGTTEAVLAEVIRLSDSGGQDRAVANAKLMTFSPALLRFIQSLASYQGGSGQGQTADEIKERALVLIEQLNAVEVRNDADRW